MSNQDKRAAELIVSRMQTKLRPPHLRRRKNVGRAHYILKLAMEKGVLQPGQTIDTKELVGLIGPDINTWFDRNPRAKDRHGATKGLGDVIGKHGLGFRKPVGKPDRLYIMPNELPEVDGDRVMTKAVYSAAIECLCAAD